MSKSISRSIKVYTIAEARKRLAELANHKNPSYSRGGFYSIVGKYKPDLIEPVITEADLEFLAGKLKGPGRPKIVDKSN